MLKVSSSYADTVNATAGLLNYYRLGESNAGVLDSFTGTAGTALSAHTADSGDAWTRRTGDTITAVLTSAGRLRKSTVSGGVGYYSNEVLTGADYLVETDITVRSLVGTAGVLGRGDINGTGTGTYYYARYDPVSSGGQFQLIKNVNGSAAFISTYNQAFTVGSTYTLGLDMKGTLIRMFVNDVQRTSINDGSITAAGRAGVGFGEPGDAATPSETAGLHLDNFNVPGGLIDSDSGNNGTYVNGPTVGVTGALTGDSDTAATFDGVNDFGTAPRQVADDLSIEFWFKSTQGIGTGAASGTTGPAWWTPPVSGAANDFGVSLRSDGRVVAGVGSSTSGSDVSITSTVGRLQQRRLAPRRLHPGEDGRSHQALRRRGAGGLGNRRLRDHLDGPGEPQLRTHRQRDQLLRGQSGRDRRLQQCALGDGGRRTLCGPVVSAPGEPLGQEAGHQSERGGAVRGQQDIATQHRQGRSEGHGGRRPLPGLEPMWSLFLRNDVAVVGPTSTCCPTTLQKSVGRAQRFLKSASTFSWRRVQQCLRCRCCNLNSQVRCVIFFVH